MAFTNALARSVACAWLMIGISLAVITFWIADRDPPFELTEQAAASAAPAGGHVQIYAKVRRDLKRQCSVSYSRYTYDSRGMRFDISPSQRMTAAAISHMDSINPDELRTTFQVPIGMHSGPAEFVTSLEYKCNPMHLIWPIQILLKVPFTVLPS